MRLKPPPKKLKPLPDVLKPLLRKTRNQVRRERYAEEPELKEAARDRSRSFYRKTQKLELTNCLRALDFYATLAYNTTVEVPGKGEREFPVMTFGDVAKCLGKIYQTLHRWIKAGMVPGPVLRVAAREAGLYHAEEVKILIEEIGNHEQRFAYYRADHKEVRDKIFARIENLRNNW